MGQLNIYRTVLVIEHIGQPWTSEEIAQLKRTLGRENIESRKSNMRHRVVYVGQEKDIPLSQILGHSSFSQYSISWGLRWLSSSQ